MNSLVELSVKNFRAIEKADIALNGITVLSGVNGSGKSTLSKTIYYIFKNANDFETLTIGRLNSRIRRYVNLFEQLYQALYHDQKSRNPVSVNFRFFSTIYPFKSLADAAKYSEIITELIAKLADFIKDNEKLVRTPELQRVYLIFKMSLKSSEEKDFPSLIRNLSTRISKEISRSIHDAEERTYSLLRDRLSSIMNDDLQNKVHVKELGVTVFGGEQTNVPILHNIQKVVYVDTPMSIGLPYSNKFPSYWNDLNSLLSARPRRGYSRSINTFIKDSIINGDTYFDDDFLNEGLKYKNNIGEVMDLLECATGIRSFAAIQILLKSLFLDENTLMIIDEPEAHLHPQWIVEYARLIVLLHKKIGVKFFIASHSPDMVEAIKSLSEKEHCMKSLCFYLTEASVSKENRYCVRCLNHDIEPIFHSFNKSYSTLDGYVGKV